MGELDKGELDKIVVVSNGKDAEAFQPGTAAERSATRRELGLTDETPLLVYAGSLGPHYYPDRMAAFAAAVQARRPEAHLLILTGSPEIGRAACDAVGLDPSRYTVRRVAPDDVPRYLAAADLGIAFRTASLSQQAVAPIKVGEYLLCGLPVLSTSGIGDLDDQLDAATGRLIDSLDDATLEAAAGWFIEEVLPTRERYRASCRERGLEHFSLARSAAQYREAFDRLRSDSASGAANSPPGQEGLGVVDPVLPRRSGSTPSPSGDSPCPGGELHCTCTQQPRSPWVLT